MISEPTKRDQEILESNMRVYFDEKLSKFEDMIKEVRLEFKKGDKIEAFVEDTQDWFNGKIVFATAKWCEVKFNGYETDDNDTIQNHNIKLQKTSVTVTALSIGNKKFKSRIKVLESKFKAVVYGSSNTEDIYSGRGSIQEYKTLNKSQVQKRQENEKEIQKVKSENVQLKSQVKATEANLKKKTINCRELQNKCKEAEKKIKEMKTKNHEQQHQIECQQGQIDTLTTKKENLHEMMRKLIEKNKKLKTQERNYNQTKSTNKYRTQTIEK